MKHKAIFIPLICVGGIVLSLATAIGALNLLKFAIYHDFYSINQDVTKCPDLNNGFIPQGVGINERGEEYDVLIAGYMNKNEASRIYITNENSESRYVSLLENKAPWLGHTGGISVSGAYAYLVNEGVHTATDGTKVVENGYVYQITLSDLLNKDVTSIDLANYNKFQTANHASCVYAGDEYIWIAEYNDDKSYPCKHAYTNPSDSTKTQKAIVTKYALSDLSTPLMHISIPNYVQGFVANPNNGEFVLSISHGLSSSYLKLYKSEEAVDLNTSLDGAPVYYLSSSYRDVKAPAMSEDLDFNSVNGKVYTVFESASDKYIFGKFFNAYDVHSLDFWPKEA